MRDRMKSFSVSALLPVGVILPFFATAGMAGSNRWSASQPEEDWGVLCVASYADPSELEIGFHGSPGGYVAGFVDLGRSTYPAEIDTRWRVDQGTVYRLRGGLNDYFGYPELEMPDEDLLSEVARGTRLTIASLEMGTLHIPLAGSAAALLAFKECLSSAAR